MDEGALIIEFSFNIEYDLSAAFWIQNLPDFDKKPIEIEGEDTSSFSGIQIYTKKAEKSSEKKIKTRNQSHVRSTETPLFSVDLSQTILLSKKEDDSFETSSISCQYMDHVTMRD